MFNDKLKLEISGLKLEIGDLQAKVSSLLAYRKQDIADNLDSNTGLRTAFCELDGRVDALQAHLAATRETVEALAAALQIHLAATRETVEAIGARVLDLEATGTIKHKAETYARDALLAEGMPNVPLAPY